MKKSAVFSLALLFVSLPPASLRAVEPPMVEIECTLTPVERSKIRPNGDRVTFECATTEQSTSTNWSGYVAAKDLSGSTGDGTVTYAAGEWVVPTLAATSDDTYCAIWVGIDGYNSDSVEQIGTSHNWINGAQQNSAWFEMYPGGSYDITGFPVNNGDVISARVGYKENGVFKLVIFNHTQGVSTTIPPSYTTSTTAKRSCAEWVVEAPYLGGILPLSDFQNVTLNYCSAIIGGVHGLINDCSWLNDEITMQNSSGTVEAQPSALLKGGSCFKVVWESQ